MPPLVLRDFTAPIVEIKATWAADWQEVDFLQVLRIGRYVASAGLDYASFRSRYGRVKLPSDGTIEIVEPRQLNDYWVRVTIPTEFSEQGEVLATDILFMGRIESRLRRISGKNFDGVATGIEEWTAYGGYQILRKTAFAGHVADVYGEKTQVMWRPGINTSRGKSYDRLGNRSANQFEGMLPHYIFYGGDDPLRGGGKREPWDCDQFARYLIEEHLPSPNEGENPSWTIEGETLALQSIKEPIDLSNAMTVADALHLAIDRQMGVDFLVRPESYGFSIFVFTLTAEETSFETSTLPANTNVLEVDASSLVDTRVTLEETNAHKYSEICVVGERMVVCGSWYDTAMKRAWKDDGPGGEDSYKTAVGDTPSDAEFNDLVRAGDQFRNVYQRFEIAPEGVDPGGGWFDGAENFPLPKSAGKIVAAELSAPSLLDRETLDWTPLVPGVDYRSKEDYDEALLDDSIEAGDRSLLPPSAILRDTSTTGNPYVIAEQVGIEVSPLPDAWGLRLTARPAHFIADGRWTGANPTLVSPRYGMDFAYFTFAWRSDHRLYVSSADYSNKPLDIGGKLVIEVPGAELWYIAPGTVYGISRSETETGVAEGQPLKAENGITVRNDSARLERVLAGAMARYGASRYRAQISVNGLSDWHKYLGYLITTINDGTDDTADLKCPVTSIDYEFESGFQTQIRAGYA